MNNCTTLIRKGCFLLLLLFVALYAKAQPALVPDSVPQLPGYVVLVGNSSDMNRLVTDDAFFFARSRGIIFRVNKYTLEKQSDFLVELRDSVLPEVRRRQWELLGIGLRGAASPEGPYRWNVTLSQRRAQVIVDFLEKHLGETHVGRAKKHTVAEDYVYLLLLMEQAGDPDADLVREVMERYADDIHTLKVALQIVDGGRLWRRLLKEYYPQLRAARLLLFFREKEKPVIKPSAKRFDASEIVLPMDEIEPAEEPEEEEPEPRRHMLAVGTNLAFYGLYVPHYGWAPMPNFELEFYPRRSRWTALFAFTCPYWQDWSNHRFFQIRDYHFEGRYYFRSESRDYREGREYRESRSPRLHTGWFVGAYANTTIYGIGWSRNDGWEGEGGGAAVKAGYVWRLGRQGRWRLEVAAAMGGFVTRYDPYVFGNPVTGTDDGKYYYDYTGNAVDFISRNYRRTWFGPTELGIKLRCDVLFWKHGHGVSFKRKEVWR